MCAEKKSTIISENLTGKNLNELQAEILPTENIVSDNLEYDDKCYLANFLKNNATKEKAKQWLVVYLAFLAVIVILNFFITPSEPHFGLDKYPLFWPIFALGIGLLLVFLVKKVIQPIIVRSEDFYGDN